MKRAGDVLADLEKSGNRAADEIAQRAVSDSTVLHSMYDGIMSSNKRIKNAAAKVLQIASENDPEILYPGFDFQGSEICSRRK